VIPKHKRNYSNQIIFMLNYDRQQAGDAARCGAVRSDGNDGKRLFCVHCIFEIQNCMMARAVSRSGFLMKLYTK